MAVVAHPGTRLRRVIAGQGALLFGGFALAQVFSFARNAIIGHWLSNGDFGIAATITLTLQLLEALSELGADRMIVQADDGDQPNMLAAVHLAFVARGFITAIALFLLAGPITSFFAIPEAFFAFQVAALAPMIKGFVHLDMRRRQRHLENGPYITVEVLPQFAALTGTVPLLQMVGSFDVVVYLALFQAIAAVILSHAVAERNYAIGCDRACMSRLIEFGWPIWLSAIPLIAVLQGDKIIVGRIFGMEELAAYNAVFMVTMVPGLLAAKVGHSLLLPLLAANKSDPVQFGAAFRTMGTIGLGIAFVFWATFTAVGDQVIELAFGPRYAGLSMLAGWLSAMWALRLAQAVPGTALMAVGQTKPLLIAGIIRASALLLSLAAALSGFGILGVVAAGVIGEIAAMAYKLAMVARHCPGVLARD